MPLYSKDSLETLRQRIDLVEVLSRHVDLKRSGAAFKGLCPFHDEKTPSFTIQKGDTHYHCFGCGAHGDAIQFLMNFQKMSFSDAVESLAERFHVHLEVIEQTAEQKGPSKALLKEALEHACRAFHFALLHTEEGHAALHYLYSRGIDLAFIQHFQIGLAPKQQGFLQAILQDKKIPQELQIAAGLVSLTSDGRMRDFFSDRITFPIRDATGAVIGFSARKYKEETFGGKYVNTPETPLFKKSRVLFGLNYCRKRIAKERQALIVEGQIDALRLIYTGFNFTVAGQGTAFGEGHVRELLNLGVNQVYLCLDSDLAGQEATQKIGNLFQKQGVDVKVVPLPEGHDPDSYLREHGTEGMIKLLEASSDYISFLVQHQSRYLNMNSPAGKTELVKTISKQIREWDNALMVHESLRKLAQLTHVPEEMIGVGQEHIPNVYIKKSASIGQMVVDADRILETDFLRWLLLMGDTQPQLVELARQHLPIEALRSDLCRQIYETFLNHFDQKRPCDFLSLVIDVEDSEAQVLLAELMQKKINRDRSEQHLVETIQKMLERNWMEKREEIRRKIQSGQCSDEEALQLAKEFDQLKRNPPKI